MATVPQIDKDFNIKQTEVPSASMPLDAPHSPVTGTENPASPYAAGSMYDKLYQSNPYAESHIEQTFWDKFANFFGARSSFDKAEAQRLQARDEYNAQIEQLRQENKYNDAEHQAQREREAGINPDLAGDVTAGEASGFDMQQTSPDYSNLTTGADIFQGLGHVLESALNLVSFGTSLPGSILAIDSARLGNQSARIKLANDVMNMAHVYADKDLRISPAVNNIHDIEPSEFQTLQAAYVNSPAYQVPKVFEDPHTQRMFDKFVRDRRMSPDYMSNTYQSFVDKESNKRSLGFMKSQGLYLDDNATAQDEFTREYIQAVGKGYMKSLKYDVKSMAEKAYHDWMYYDEMNKSENGDDPVARARAKVERLKYQNDRFFEESKKQMIMPVQSAYDYLIGIINNKKAPQLKKDFAYAALPGLSGVVTAINSNSFHLPDISIDRSDRSRHTHNTFKSQYYGH